MLEFWSRSKSEMWSSVKICHWLNFLVFCRQVRVESRWPRSSCASLVIYQQVGLSEYSPLERFPTSLWRFGCGLQTLIRHLITRDSKLFRWAQWFLLCQDFAHYMILCTFSDICLCRSWGRITWNKELEIFVDFSLWCEDRANLGISRGKGAWGGDRFAAETNCVWPHLLLQPLKYCPTHL